jgi:hypothetical protein
MSGGIFGDAFDQDEKDKLYRLGFIPGLGFCVPILGLHSDLVVVKRNLAADD